MDRRKYPRFIAEENLLVAVLNGSNIIGKVKDISLGGLSFEHLYDPNLNWVNSKRIIRLLVDDFKQFKITCRIVYDFPLPIPAEYGPLIIQLTTSRCGVEFEALTDDQLKLLKLFIKTYTQGESKRSNSTTTEISLTSPGTPLESL